MAKQLAEVFGDLGISQYLDSFLDQGFDTWETILDITESDLDALGVKLGHRRKLQRRIANTRGLAPDAALVSPIRPSAEESRPEAPKPEPTTAEAPEPTLAVATKRKYRRHPKADENAPERPPSAYVLFSNKMRDDLKSRNLTFTEIAKLVGENWQNLSQAEKEPFESLAQSMKDRYNNDLAEYKKTPQYKTYAAYLAEFKAKHPAHPPEKDASKRVKLSESGNQSSSSSSTVGIRAPRGRSNTANGHDYPATRQHRVHSTVSNSGSQYSASQYALMDDNMSSPSGREEDVFTDRHQSTSISPREAPVNQLPASLPGWESSTRSESTSSTVLPPLSDMLDNGTFISGNAPVPDPATGFHYRQQRVTTSETPGPVPGLVGGASRPSLRPEYSSTGSSSSSSSFPRTPMEGSLPIHALLSGKSLASDYPSQMSPLPLASSISPDTGKPILHPPDRSSSDPAVVPHMMNGAGSFMRQPPQVLPGHTVTSPRGQNHNVHSPPPAISGTAQLDAQRLDGMAALLQAGEIVGRRSR